MAKVLGASAAGQTARRLSQLAAVGAGGMLELLARDTGAVELTEIYRFTHAWERAASVRLREGDPEVLAIYDAHGRIWGGTEQEMTDAAVRGYRADVLQGQGPVGAENSVKSCDLHVLVYETAEPVSSQRPDGRCAGRGSVAGGRVLIE